MRQGNISFILIFTRLFNNQQMRKEAVGIKSYLLKFIPNNLKTQQMCVEAVHKEPFLLKEIHDHFKTLETCDKALHNRLYLSEYVADSLISQQMYIKEVREDPGVWAMSPIFLKPG